MANTISAAGSCLCGKVTIMTNSMSTNIGACHCNTCRKWSGGSFLASDCGNDVLFEGEENIKVCNSSQWAERGVCNNYGTHLFYRMKGNGKYIILSSLFDLDEKLTFAHQVFIDEKPSYYCFSNETDNMTGKEIFEKLSPS